eukprot:1182042-Prorocentrum_minimum.AAC.4
MAGGEGRAHEGTLRANILASMHLQLKSQARGENVTAPTSSQGTHNREFPLKAQRTAISSSLLVLSLCSNHC